MYHLLSSPFYFLSLLVVTQIRGHIAGSSPPLPYTVRALHFFFRDKISALASSTRVELLYTPYTVVVVHRCIAYLRSPVRMYIFRLPSSQQPAGHKRHQQQVVDEDR